MNVKIDTKEKFTSIEVLEHQLSANMTGELKQLLLSYLQRDIPHIVLNIKIVNKVDNVILELLSNIQHEFYQKNCSFVICEVQQPLKEGLSKLGFLEKMNITPTESEAWDILQMEEIERELFSDE